MGNDKEVVEGQVFEISYNYNSSVGTYTFIKHYDEKYLEKVEYRSRYNGRDGMKGCSTTGFGYFKAKKRGTTKIILGHKFRGSKMGNTSIRVKIKKHDGKTPIENPVYKIEKQHTKGLPKKICLVGDSKVGKTSLINCFKGEDFNDTYTPSKACNYIDKIMTYQNKEIELEIWDTIGNEKYRPLNKLFYKDSSIIIFVYDITNKNSFENIKNIWYQDVQDCLGKEIMIVILGNKSDLYIEEEVREEEARVYAKSVNAKLKIVSAKDSFQVDKFFEELIGDYLNS